MRNTTIASLVLLGSVLVAGCDDNPLAARDALSTSEPSLGITTGEKFASISITEPSAPAFALALGGTAQMSALLKYSAGGTLPAVPYATWRSTDNCVATVTSGAPSWGLVKSVNSGTTLIITEAWGRADTVKVTVAGTRSAPESCYDAEWRWDFQDVSFTGAGATRYAVAAGETLKRVVLFAIPNADRSVKVGGKATLLSELWYSRGGKLNGKGYVTFSVTDGAVASVNSKGVVNGLKVGKTKVVARLGELADTVPLYVR